MENIESKYFIDDEKYNCPFCKNRGVKYIILSIVKFNESINKNIYAIFVECSQCHNISMHLSKTDYFEYKKLHALIINTNAKESKLYSDGYFCRAEEKLYFTKYIKNPDNDPIYYTSFAGTETINIDDSLILNIPTSFFTIDNRIPKIFRELITEAENCISNNCLTGASACIRKTIYEFINKEKLDGNDYTTKIKSLKGKYNNLNDMYVDILSAIQGITSDQVHEQSYENFDSQHAKVYLKVLKEIFNQIYVIPNELKNTQSEISSMLNSIKKDKSQK